MEHYLVRLAVDSSSRANRRTGSFDSDNGATRITTLGGDNWRLVEFKGESGTLSPRKDTNIFCETPGRRAWVSVCSVSVFTTKTLGVQHQIQDALVVFVDHFNLVYISFVLFSVSLVAHGISTLVEWQVSKQSFWAL